jgi:hypothetical protein
MYGGEEIKLHAFFAVALDGNEWVAQALAS